MSIAFVAVGASSVGSNSLTPGHPTVSAGNYEILGVANKYPTNAPTTPSGWSLLGRDSGGHGGAGVDTGDIYITAYGRDADGTETGTFTVTIGSGNSSIARAASSRGSEASWDAVAVRTSAQNSPSTTWFVTTASAISVMEGDMLVAISAVNSNTYSFSSPVMSMIGIVFSPEAKRTEVATAVGDDAAFVISTHKVASGSSVGFLTYAMTASGADTDSPAGATCIVRLREMGAGADIPKRRRTIIVNRLRSEPDADDD